MGEHKDSKPSNTAVTVDECVLAHMGTNFYPAKPPYVAFRTPLGLRKEWLVLENSVTVDIVKSVGMYLHTAFNRRMSRNDWRKDVAEKAYGVSV